MQAKRLVNKIVKLGGTAEIVERDGMRSSYCIHCAAYVTHRHVLNMTGDDYDAWLTDDHTPCTSPDGKHEGLKSWEVVGELNGHDVHMFLCNSGQPADGGNSYFTTRAFSRRGEYDMGADYNPGGWTFCNRLADLEWAC